MWDDDNITCVKLKNAEKKVCFRKQLEETIRFKNQRKELQGKSVAISIMKCLENKKFQAFMKLSSNASQYQGKLNAVKYMNYIIKSRIQKNRIIGFRKIKQKLIYFSLAKNLARNLYFLSVRKQNNYKTFAMNKIKQQKISPSKPKTKTERFSKNMIFQDDSEEFSSKFRQYLKKAQAQSSLQVKATTLKNILGEEIKYFQKVEPIKKDSNKNHQILLKIFKKYVQSTMELQIIDVTNSSYELNRQNSARSCRSFGKINSTDATSIKQKQFSRLKQLICYNLQHMDFSKTETQITNLMTKFTNTKFLSKSDEKILTTLSEFIHQNQRVYKAIEDCTSVVQTISKISIEKSTSNNLSSAKVVQRQLHKLTAKYQKQQQTEGYASDFLHIAKFLLKILQNLQQSIVNNPNDLSFQSEIGYSGRNRNLYASSSSRNLLTTRPNSQDKNIVSNEATIKKLLAQKAALAQQLKESTRTLQQLNNDRNQIKLEIQKYQLEKQQFNSQFTNFKKQIEKLNKDKNEYLKKIRKLELDLQEKDSEKMQLQEDLKIQKQSTIDLQNINQYLNQENKQLLCVVEKRQKQLENMNKKMNDLNETNTTLNQLIQQTQQQADRYKIEISKFREKQIQDLQQKQRILQMNNNELKQLQLLVEEQKEQNLKLKEELQRQKQSFTLLLEKNNMHETKDQICDLSVKGSENILIQLEYEQNLKILTQIRQQNAELQTINEQLQANQSHLRFSNDNLKSKIQQHKIQRQKLLNKVSFLQKQIQYLKFPREEPCQKCKQLQIHKEKYEKLNIILAMKEKHIVDLEANIKNIKDSIINIEHKQLKEASCNCVLQQHDERDNQIAQLRQNIESLKENINILQQSNQKLRHQLADQTKARLYLTEKLTSSKQQISAAIQNQTKIKQQMAKLRIIHKQEIALIQEENQVKMKQQINRALKQQEQQVNIFIRKADQQRQAFYQNVALPQIRMQWQRQLQPFIGSLISKQRMKWSEQNEKKFYNVINPQSY